MDGSGIAQWLIVEGGIVIFAVFVCRRACPLRLRAQEGVLLGI